jgi:hypothetical protein
VVAHARARRRLRRHDGRPCCSRARATSTPPRAGASRSRAPSRTTRR